MARVSLPITSIVTWQEMLEKVQWGPRGGTPMASETLDRASD
jgi:hypothetical protein